jgi:hypothetical protein
MRPVVTRHRSSFLLIFQSGNIDLKIRSEIIILLLPLEFELSALSVM